MSRRSRLRLQGQRRQGGFTLTELMITVALIGTLASVAIPSFLSYQARTRRAEAFTTLTGIATSLKGFHAEEGYYPDMANETGQVTLPGNLAVLGTTKLDWDPAEVFFDLVGFEVDGDVWHSYDVTASGETNCDPCINCFTLTAHGDTDSDTFVSAVMYVHPERDAAGNVTGECKSALSVPAGGYSAPVGAGGAAIYDQPAVNFGAGDQY